MKEALRSFLELENCSFVMMKLEWLGLLDETPVPIEYGDMYDFVECLYKDKLGFASGEEDLSVMMHRYVVEYPDRRVVKTSTLIDYGSSDTDFSVAKLTGLPDVYKRQHLGYTDFETFVRVIPFQFYAIGTLFMIPIVALTGREFGAMFRAEKRAIELNQPYAPGSQTARTTIDTQDVHPGATYNMMLLPLIVLFVTIFGLLIPQGFPLQPVKGAVLRSALCTGYLLGAFVCMPVSYTHLDVYKRQGERKTLSPFIALAI